jgi:hypothetical protein
MEAIFNGIMLTGPTQSEHTGPIAFPWDRLVQIDPLVRGTGKFLADRGNDSSLVTFECLRRYSGLLAAMDARATFIRSLAGSGELELSQFAGGSTLTIVATAVRGSTPEPALIGIAVRFRFAFHITSLNTSTVVGEGAYQRNENGSILRSEDGTPIIAD